MQPLSSTPQAIAWLGCLMCLSDLCLAAQQRDIELLRPRSGQRGTTVDVILEGRDIRDAREVLFYRPGIRAIDFENMPPRKRNVSLHHGGIVRDRVRCRFVIAPNCPLGEHALRLRTARTLSTVATFWVGRFPIIPELERGGFEVSYRGGETVVIANDKAIRKPNDSLETAQPIPLNSTVAGEIKVTRELDDDYFRVELDARQRLSVEIDSVRLCDKAYAESEYDLLVRILDSDGQVLLEQDDSDLHVQDPIASLIAPRKGTYYIHVRQQLFKAGRWVYYRAHIGSFQRPLIAFPLGGQAGVATRFRLLGDPGGPTEQDVTLPRRPGEFRLFPGSESQKPPSGLPLRVSTFPNVLEQPTPVTEVATLPAALNGIISRPGEQDIFRVQVTRGKRYRVRVFARGLGSPLDSRIWFRHASEEENELEADDATWADRGKPVVPRSLQRPELLDSSVVFTPRRDGEYLLGIADMRGLGGDRFVYRIEVEPARDVIHTHTVSWANDRFEINRTAGFIVPQSNRWTTNVYIAPEPGTVYDGPLRLVARGLPPGVTMTAPVFYPGMNGVPVQLAAAPGTRPQSCLFSIDLVKLEGEGEIRSTSQAYVPFINHSGGRSWHHAHLTQFALGVIDSSPFTVELEPPSIPISQSGELKLRVRVKRQNGFEGAIDIQPDWYPNGISGGGAVTIAAGETEAEYSLSASSRATPGTWKMTMNATTTGGDAYSGVGRIRVSSNVVELTVGSPHVALAFKPCAVRRGQVATVRCDVTQLQPFQQPARARLVGLPKGVVVVGGPYLLRPGDKTIVFMLRASPQALLGRYAQWRCELTFQQAGQSIRQLTGKGILRVDPAVKD